MANPYGVHFFTLTKAGSNPIGDAIFLPLFPSVINVSGCISLHPMYGKSVWKIQKNPGKDEERRGSSWTRLAAGGADLSGYLTPIWSAGSMTV